MPHCLRLAAAADRRHRHRLSLLAAWLTALLITRIDRAMTALMTSAERIGRGLYSEPVPASGVPEIADLERALERMRAGARRARRSRATTSTRCSTA